MSRIQVACYSLLASAFLLAGLLVTQVGDQLTNPAHGAMVVNQQNFTLLTASTRENEEAMFLMDNNSGQLLIYRTDVAQNRVEPVAVVPIRQLFQRGNIGGNTAPGGAGGNR